MLNTDLLKAFPFGKVVSIKPIVEQVADADVTEPIELCADLSELSTNDFIVIR